MTAREAEQAITDNGGEPEPSEKDYEDPSRNSMLRGISLMTARGRLGFRREEDYLPLKKQFHPPKRKNGISRHKEPI